MLTFDANGNVVGDENIEKEDGGNDYVTVLLDEKEVNGRINFSVATKNNLNEIIAIHHFTWVFIFFTVFNLSS